MAKHWNRSGLSLWIFFAGTINLPLRNIGHENHAASSFWQFQSTLSHLERSSKIMSGISGDRSSFIVWSRYPLLRAPQNERPISPCAKATGDKDSLQTRRRPWRRGGPDIHFANRSSLTRLLPELGEASAFCCKPNA